MLGLPVVLNEVLYDPAGVDGGFEFVELVNRTALPVALAGFRLEAGDGAGPERWTTRWTGQPGDVVPAFGRFVVGEGRVEPPPDRVVSLGLENGPDALRLLAPDGAVDVAPLRGEAFGLDRLDEALGLLARTIPGRDAVRVSLVHDP